MLTDWELSSMRDELAKVLSDRCKIYSKTSVSDGMGDFTDTWTQIDEVDCRLDADVSGEALAGQAIQPFERYTLTLPHGTTISTANRVVVNGTTYNVTGISTGNSWALDIRAKVQPI